MMSGRFMGSRRFPREPASSVMMSDRYNGKLLVSILLLLAGTAWVSCSPESSPTISDSPLFVQRPPYEWPLSHPSSQKLDTVLLDSAIHAMRAEPFVYSFLVVRNDTLVVEEYRNGLSKYNDYEIRSVTKSFISALVGISLDRGLFDSTGQTLLSFFPEYQTAALDPRTSTITLEHLLTMRAGFDYVEGNDYSAIYLPDGDWLKTTIELPLRADPGTQFIYASPVTHLLSGFVTRASGMSTAAFAEAHLFATLEISPRLWDRDPKGIFLGGTGMNFTPRDLARLGSLYLHQGLVDGRRVLSEEWVRRTVEPSNPHNSLWGSLEAVNYGYQWWTNWGGPDSLFFAAGYGGQFVFVLPQAHMIVVTTADVNVSAAQANDQELAIMEIVTRWVLPAVEP